MLAPSEVPNTKNVIIWPEKILNEIRRVEKFDQTNKEIDAIPRKLKKSNSFKLFNFLESCEYYAFVVLGSVMWILLARAILIWQRFPFHRHPFEIILIYTVPILLLLLVLFLLDMHFQKRKVE
jgi:hypothetical protein